MPWPVELACRSQISMKMTFLIVLDHGASLAFAIKKCFESHRIWTDLNEQFPMVCLGCLENKYFPRHLIFGLGKNATEPSGTQYTVHVPVTCTVPRVRVLPPRTNSVAVAVVCVRTARATTRP